jgi:hypothetical protein
MRGFLTVLGIRTTPGSCESLPQSREDLFESFNAIFNKKTDKNEKTDKTEKTDKNEKTEKNELNYRTKITVGARALSKHSDRTSDKEFWGLCNGSELDRNIKANEIFNKILDECVWINIYYLSNSNKILEVRNAKGYGIRWNLNGEFRGLIEPEDKKEKKY